MNRCTLAATLIPIIAMSSCNNDPIEPPSDSPVYQSDWTSLRKHNTPEWLIDAKFGIYCHWGIQTLQYIPKYENLSNEERVELFKAEKFDADEWAALFERAGAKFGGVIGWHGSPFKHWDTEYSDFNSVKMGPKIDIVGEVSAAVRKRGMKTLVSYHSIRDDDWIQYAKESINNYSPDIFWVDASFGGTKGAQHRKSMDKSKYIGETPKPARIFPEKYQRDVVTHFYNHALEAGKEVEFMYKSFDIPPNIGMRDYENGLLPETAYDVWITDMDMNVPPDWETHGWFWRDSVPVRSTNELVDMLVDVVSKNGIYLLNVPPLADGSFPEVVVENLKGLGDWLEANGEAIYGTSPWFIHGEGPKRISEENYTFHHNNHFATIQYSEEDIRFTTKGDNLYAICLGKPATAFEIRSLNSTMKVHEGTILKVTHLASGKEVEFDHNEEALVLDLSEIGLDDSANAFRLELNFK